MNTQEQKHPLENRDRPIVDNLLQSKSTPANLVELARLRIRYRNFPGARDIQRDLELVLSKWQLTEAQLYAKTRQIHATGKIYRQGLEKEQEDWS